MALSVQRDLIGYGANPPDPNWPSDARLALNFVLNYEEGSEYSIGDNDGSPIRLGKSASSPVPRAARSRRRSRCSNTAAGSDSGV